MNAVNQGADSLLNGASRSAAGLGIGSGLLLIGILSAMAPRPVYAYIDPNTAGSLYQVLFPILVAIGTALAAMRRVIAAHWYRFVKFSLSTYRRLVGSRRSEPNP